MPNHLTPAEQARIADIDRQRAELANEKRLILTRARVRKHRDSAD